LHSIELFNVPANPFREESLDLFLPSKKELYNLCQINFVTKHKILMPKWRRNKKSHA